MWIRTLVALLLILSSPALANTDGDAEDRASSFYVTAGGSAALSLEAGFLGETLKLTLPTGWGFAIASGYRPTPQLAVEFEFQRADLSDRFETTISDTDSFSAFQSAEIWTMMINGKYYPAAEIGIPIQPYVRIGAGALRGELTEELAVACSPPDTCIVRVNENDLGVSDSFSSQSDNWGLAMKFGIGSDFLVHERFYLYFDYAYHLAITDGIDGFSFSTVGGGIGYRW
jgi:opacity protein-like surface antigen